MPADRFRVNGREVTANSWDAEQPLLYVLRNDMGLHGAKFGCGLGQCKPSKSSKWTGWTYVAGGHIGSVVFMESGAGLRCP